MDGEGVTETVITEKRLTPQQYIDNLTSALAEAKEEGLCQGKLTKNPTEVQKSLMAEVMNAIGFCSTKWIGYCHTKAEKEMEQIQADEDECVRDDTVKAVLTRMFTRRSAHNSKLVCALTATDGCTKSFVTHWIS